MPLRSINRAGWLRRKLIMGTRLWPPANTLASAPCSAKSSRAWGREEGARYSKVPGFMVWLSAPVHSWVRSERSVAKAEISAMLSSDVPLQPLVSSGAGLAEVQGLEPRVWRSLELPSLSFELRRERRTAQVRPGHHARKRRTGLGSPPPGPSLRPRYSRLPKGPRGTGQGEACGINRAVLES